MGIGAAEASVKRRVAARSRAGTYLPGRLDADIHAPVSLGAPLVDVSGGVVAVLTRVCRMPDDASHNPGASASTNDANPARRQGGEPGTCSPSIAGVPVQALRTFLAKFARGAPPAAALSPVGVRPTESPSTAAPSPAPPPWLGIRGETEKGSAVHGIRVVAVAPSSPAERAGLQPGADVIAAVDGQPVDTPEKLAENISQRNIGDTVQLIVLGRGEIRTVDVTLTRKE
jgi:serine protease Do